MASAATQRAPVLDHSPQTGHYTQITTASSNQAQNVIPRNITATFNYFKPNEDGSPPAPSYVNQPETFARPTESHQRTVYDIRGSEEKYSLDTTGFQLVNHVSKEKDFFDDTQIKDVYYTEVEEILKKTTGASKVFIFDHTIRRQSQDKREPSSDTRGPVQRVHIDQSYRAGPERVKHHLPLEAPVLLRGRYQIINIWRPIRTILKDPLGIASANSVLDSELVPIGLIYPDREGETYAVKAGEGHEWHYVYKQTPEEVLLIKCFDSKTDGRARRVPHSAFVDEEFVGEEPRESIEVRALVFHPDDGA